jgi:hypothetical protein
MIILYSISQDTNKKITSISKYTILFTKSKKLFVVIYKAWTKTRTQHEY